MQECKAVKEKYFQDQQLDLITYAMQPKNLDDMVSAEFEKKSIILDPGLVNPTKKIDHLSKKLQDRLGTIFSKHSGLFSRSKHHLGKFVGFQAEAHIDETSKIDCKQTQRNRVLPPSCKQDLFKYKQSGLFADSTGKTDYYCSNLTFVL